MRKSDENLIDVDVGEILKPIQGYENRYLISSYGRVWSIRGKKWLKYSVPSNGYAQIILCVNFHKKARMIHRLVAETFLPKIEGKEYVNHKDGNKLNNNINNLEWCTCSENQQHVNEMGLKHNIPYGDKSVMAKLTWDDIHFMREHYKPYDEQYNTTMLAKIFNIDKSEAYAIIANKRWKEEDYHYEKRR